MIGSLRGSVLNIDIGTGEALIEVGGVGYRVSMTAAGLRHLPGTGPDGHRTDGSGSAFVYIHHAIREADQHLYGFVTLDERAVFESLLSAHGVGPALALAVMGVHNPTALRLAVANDDVDALCTVPGVGKKTAARLLIELKNRLALPDDVDGVIAAMSDKAEVPGTVKADVVEALTGLGYGHDEIRNVVASLPDDGDVSDLLKAALQQLAMPL